MPVGPVTIRVARVGEIASSTLRVLNPVRRPRLMVLRMDCPRRREAWGLWRRCAARLDLMGCP